MYGALAASVDKRVKTYVLIAGEGTFSNWSLQYWPVTASKGEAIYRESMNPLEPINVISRAAPAALLFQFAHTDKYISKANANAFFDAASKPKEIIWYDSDHHLNIEAARNDRREWLTRQLSLGGKDRK